MKLDELLRMENEIERFDAVCMPALLAPSLTEEEKTEKTRIAACDSMLWCIINAVDGHIRVLPDSDSLWVKGLALLIKEEAEKRTISELAQCALRVSEVLYENGIIDGKRRRGMAEIEKRVMLCAEEYIKKCSQ